MLPSRSILLLTLACGSSSAISYGCYRINSASENQSSSQLLASDQNGPNSSAGLTQNTTGGNQEQNQGSGEVVPKVVVPEGESNSEQRENSQENANGSTGISSPSTTDQTPQGSGGGVQNQGGA